MYPMQHEALTLSINKTVTSDHKAQQTFMLTLYFTGPS